VPGLVLIFFFDYLRHGLASEHNLHSMIGVVMLVLFVWLWAEAGRPGLVVMPVDLPEGRDDMNFTGDGVANALETELERFGLSESGGTYGDTEASKILARELGARLFPRSPWYKGADVRLPGIEGLQASHVVVGTDIEGFPLSNIYHILRHLRGMPLLEAQILLGNDDSLTLALRRSNAPLNCTTDRLSNAILSDSGIIHRKGQDAVEELWNVTEPQRTSVPNGPNTLGCSYGAIRFLLDWLDIVHLPSSGEERIANVTVHELNGDTRLSVALHLAALQAIEHLSNERMALYYDDAGRYDSAFSFYQKSLSDLLREARDDPPYLQEFARQRLASALIRIGDFKDQLQNDCPGADDSYALAASIFPDDLHVLARIGYGYLIRAREGQWGSQTCEQHAKDIFKSITYLRAAVSVGGKNTAVRRYGMVR
jgi:tetratricopeptide (TPR) repeat protein